ALTRAARRLYVPCWPAPAAGDGRRLAELLNARVQGWLSAGGEEGLVAVERIAPEDGAAPATGAGDLAATWQPPDALRAGAEAGAAPLGLAGDRLGPVTTSYTRLKQAERASRAPEVATFDAGDPGDLDPTDPEPDTAGDGPAQAGEPGADQAPGGRTVGIFLHEVIEALPLGSAAEEEELERWSARP